MGMLSNIAELPQGAYGMSNANTAPSYANQGYADGGYVWGTSPVDQKQEWNSFKSFLGKAAPYVGGALATFAPLAAHAYMRPSTPSNAGVQAPVNDGYSRISSSNYAQVAPSRPMTRPGWINEVNYRVAPNVPFMKGNQIPQPFANSGETTRNLLNSSQFRPYANGGYVGSNMPINGQMNSSYMSGGMNPRVKNAWLSQAMYRMPSQQAAPFADGGYVWGNSPGSENTFLSSIRRGLSKAAPYIGAGLGAGATLMGAAAGAPSLLSYYQPANNWASTINYTHPPALPPRLPSFAEGGSVNGDYFSPSLNYPEDNTLVAPATEGYPSYHHVGGGRMGAWLGNDMQMTDRYA